MLKVRGDNKYNATKVAFNARTKEFCDYQWAKNYLNKNDRIIFDSKLEANVFSHLLKHFELEQIEVHKPIYLNKATLYYPNQHWNVDFRFTLSTNNFRLIEVKGFVTESFKWQLKYMSVANERLLYNLTIVTSNEPSKLQKKLGLIDHSLPIIHSRNVDRYIEKLRLDQSA